MARPWKKSPGANHERGFARGGNDLIQRVLPKVQNSMKTSGIRTFFEVFVVENYDCSFFVTSHWNFRLPTHGHFQATGSLCFRLFFSIRIHSTISPLFPYLSCSMNLNGEPWSADTKSIQLRIHGATVLEGDDLEKRADALGRFASHF